ncbi:hypothetical protein BS50DRAFT_304876 [Corynespora cassiicola Philippines]|uniref:Uncharacterized protein n=1 Tax=Corynespora cassiicola Philippines TaxID=1448308 RepID=A0A2T2NYC7_CORCC|nr:hypothetical protein BS50DRAFT_304876 [Corynespora cassiicola Philippines]
MNFQSCEHYPANRKACRRRLAARPLLQLLGRLGCAEVQVSWSKPCPVVLHTFNQRLADRWRKRSCYSPQLRLLQGLLFSLLCPSGCSRAQSPRVSPSVNNKTPPAESTAITVLPATAATTPPGPILFALAYIYCVGAVRARLSISRRHSNFALARR